MLVLNPGQCLRGDAANPLDKVGGYAVVNLRTSLRSGPGVELYGLVRNLFDERFSTFGTLYDLGLDEALGLGLADPSTATPACRASSSAKRERCSEDALGAAPC